MGLPVLNLELRYKVDLPISGKTVEVRPYLVKEEKVLLTAMETEDKKSISAAVHTILSNCTFGYDVDSLPLLDVEYLMLKLKMYSAGEVITVHVKCNNTVTRPTLDTETGEPTGESEERKCGFITDVDIDLEEKLLVDTSEILDPFIQLTDAVGVSLRSPVFDMFEAVINSESNSEVTFEILASCLDFITDEDAIIRDFTADEAQEFLGNLNKKQLKAIKAYLESIPQLTIKHDYKCIQCGYEQELVLRNFFDFFTD